MTLPLLALTLQGSSNFFSHPTNRSLIVSYCLCPKQAARRGSRCSLLGLDPRRRRFSQHQHRSGLPCQLHRAAARPTKPFSRMRSSTRARHARGRAFAACAPLFPLPRLPPLLPPGSPCRAGRRRRSPLPRPRPARRPPPRRLQVTFRAAPAALRTTCLHIASLAGSRPRVPIRAALLSRGPPGQDQAREAPRESSRGARTSSSQGPEIPRARGALVESGCGYPVCTAIRSGG